MGDFGARQPFPDNPVQPFVSRHFFLNRCFSRFKDTFLLAWGHYPLEFQCSMEVEGQQEWKGLHMQNGVCSLIDIHRVHHRTPNSYVVWTGFPNSHNMMQLTCFTVDYFSNRQLFSMTARSPGKLHKTSHWNGLNSCYYSTNSNVILCEEVPSEQKLKELHEEIWKTSIKRQSAASAYIVYFALFADIHYIFIVKDLIS